MSNNKDRRVLNRMGAHELTQEEMEKITGNGNNLNTFASNTGTLPLTHPDTDFDQ
ncbi:MAG TPA: hypothetical protein VKY85_15740 [Candidatus Angelobacter sp.]|nr:hypothetical protein [Candidatus Angelobacter sp.]